MISPGLPLVGHVAAGQPIVAEENIEEYIQTPEFAGGDAGSYLLRVRGESMKDVGIMEGDLVVVKPGTAPAEDGEIVVALVGEEATVKRFFQETDHVRLRPENAEMSRLASGDVRVLGQVIELMQDICMNTVDVRRTRAPLRSAGRRRPGAPRQLGSRRRRRPCSAMALRRRSRHRRTW